MRRHWRLAKYTNRVRSHNMFFHPQHKAYCAAYGPKLHVQAPSNHRMTDSRGRCSLCVPCLLPFYCVSIVNAVCGVL